MEIARTFKLICACSVFPVFLSVSAIAGPSKYETGKTIYKPNRAYNGYTVCHFPANKDVSLIDMHGNIVHRWVNDDGLGMGTTPIPLPNGNLLVRHPRAYLQKGEEALAELDWDGNVVWEFSHPSLTRLHHDQRKLPNGNYLGLAYRMRTEPALAPFDVKDDVIFEVTPGGQIIWEWSSVDNVDQFELDQDAWDIMSDPEAFPYNIKLGDLFHTNSIQPLPENKFFDRGREEFRPGNILVSQRNTNIIFIIDRLTGEVVWKMGPRDGFTIGQHDPNMIAPGLKGAGNILVYDNGGRGGYPPERYRPYTRVLEINPVKREIVWRYDAESSGAPRLTFFSEFTGNAMRLPNKNTLITESSWGRIFEVDRQGAIVWEWLSPFVYKPFNRLKQVVPRCYRVGPDWPTGPFE